MLVKKMVMSNKKTKNTNPRLFSLQLKKALFYAFYEARKQGSDVVDSQYLLYGLLKDNDSLSNRLIHKVCKVDSISNPNQKLIAKLKINFKRKSQLVVFSTNKSFPNFSRPVKKLLFSLIKSTRTDKKSILTSLHVLNYLVRNKHISKWVKDNFK